MSEWLDADQQRAWLAFMRVQHRINFEANRQLQADSGLSLADYDVLNVLVADPLSITDMARILGWERSRVSHQTKRMATRGLVRTRPHGDDRRITVVEATEAGRQANRDAAPGHVALVRRLFFDGLSPQAVRQLAAILETVHETIGPP
uniref:MarR family winged helix-turn-helix transcriptional regulator n=1 Tax=Paractinoplanes polyasparticus TaxID=2856853 RepID=UPI0027E098AA|nr:MarR family transcriptional regulator [Actinoplanes polyasparticus]